MRNEKIRLREKNTKILYSIKTMSSCHKEDDTVAGKICNQEEIYHQVPITRNRAHPPRHKVVFPSQCILTECYCLFTSGRSLTWGSFESKVQDDLQPSNNIFPNLHPLHCPIQIRRIGKWELLIWRFRVHPFEMGWEEGKTEPAARRPIWKVTCTRSDRKWSGSKERTLLLHPS